MAANTATKTASGRKSAATQSSLSDMSDLVSFELGQFLAGKKHMIPVLGALAGSAPPQMRGALHQAMIENIVHTEMLASVVGQLELGGEPERPKGLEGLVEEIKDLTKAKNRDEKSGSRLSCFLMHLAHLDLAVVGSIVAHSRLADQYEVEAALQPIERDTKQCIRRLRQLSMQVAETDDEPGSSELMQNFEMGLQDFIQRRIRMSRYREEEYGSSWGQGSRSGGGRSSSRYDEDDDRGSRGSSSRYEDDDDRNEGRSRGGRQSSQMQERDEYGQFTGSRGGSSGGSRYRDDDDDSGWGGGSRSRRGGGSRNDDEERFGGYEGRSRGGQHSGEMQERDEYGQFTGYRSGGGGGSRSSRYEDDDDDRGGSRGRGRQSSRYDEDDDRGSRSSRGGRGDITDSAGRHYSRDSWERAQEGRARGGQHSHGGGRGGRD